MQNGPVVTTPHYVEFDGAASFMQVADANALSFVSGAVDTPLTLDLWMRPDDLNNRAQLLGKWGESTNQEYRLFASGNTLRLDLRDESAGATVSAYTSTSRGGPGRWLASPGGHV